MIAVARPLRRPGCARLGARRTGGALVAGGSAASDVAPKTTLPDVEDEVMCTICGTALNLSASPQADRERAFIRREIAAGKTKDQIKDELVAQYGTEVLAEPPKSGFDLTAWLVPGAAIAAWRRSRSRIGLARWRRAGRRAAVLPRRRRSAAGPLGRRAPRRRPGSLRPLTAPHSTRANSTTNGDHDSRPPPLEGRGPRSLRGPAPAATWASSAEPPAATPGRVHHPCGGESAPTPAAAGSGADEVEGVRELEGAVGVAALEVALLVADVGDDPVALAFDLGPLAALVRDGREAARVERQPGPAGVAGALQVGTVCERTTGMLSGRPVMKNTAMPFLRARRGGRAEGRRDRRVVRVGDPDRERADRVGEVRRRDVRVVGERGLVDVEDEGRLGRRGRPASSPCRRCPEQGWLLSCADPVQQVGAGPGVDRPAGPSRRRPSRGSS